MGSDESHFSVSVESDGQSHKTSGIEPRSFRLPALRLTARPNRLTGKRFYPWTCIYPMVLSFPSLLSRWRVVFLVRLFPLGTRVGCPGVTAREPVWPSDNPDKQTELGSNLLRLSLLFKSCGLWTPSCGFVPHSYETLKWLSSAAHLNAGVILVVTV